MSDDDDPGVVAAHDVQPQLALLVAPTSSGKRNTIRMRPVAIACARLNRTGFDFDSSLVTPAMIPALRRLAATVDANPAAPLSVFGHADPVGDDAYNKQLAGRRAMAVYALLARNTDLWEQLYSSPMGGDDWHTSAIAIMLGHLLNGDGDSYLAAAQGSVSAATRAFQRDHGLVIDGVAGPRTRAQLFVAYMDAICVRADGTAFEVPAERFLGGNQDARGKAAYQGCGEFNPVFLFSRAEASRPVTGAARQDRDAQNAINRRVMILLFRPGTTIDPVQWPCPRASEDGSGCKAQFWPDGEQRRLPRDEQREYRITRDTMACRFYDGFARRSPCEGVITTTIEIQLYDDQVALLPDAHYRITVESDVRTGIAQDGTARLKRVAVPSTCLVEWNPASGSVLTKTAGTARFQMTVFLDTDSPADDESARRKLHNIGYPVDTDLPSNLLAFQADEELPQTGQLDDPTRKRLDEVHRLLAGDAPELGTGATGDDR